jgi:hypothetical protein
VTFKHGYEEAAILHVLDRALSVVDLDPDSDPPRVLAIGAAPSGHLLESSGSSLTGALIS